MNRKKTKSVLKRAYSVMIVVLLLISTMFTTPGCEEIERANFSGALTDTLTYIRNNYQNMDRALDFGVKVDDDLLESVATFTQTATLTYKSDDVQFTFKPYTYLNIKLSKERIYETKEADIPTTVESSVIRSQIPYHEGQIFGLDVVKEFTFKDGQTATVSYGHRYYGVIVKNDTLAVPHIEVQNVAFNEQLLSAASTDENGDKLYKSVMDFLATYSIKGTSSADKTTTVHLKPWYEKVLSAEALKVLNVTYDGQFVNCPFTGYKLTETVNTNKGEMTNVYEVDLRMSFTKPGRREQPALDSLYNAKSTGTLTKSVLADTKTDNGFSVRTMSGTYKSVNTGTKSKTSVESSLEFTYQYPTAFESEYGKYTISPVTLTFEENGFDVEYLSETETAKRYLSTNTVTGKIGSCTLDDIDEEVVLILQKEKKADVVKTDSVYTYTGSGDDYIVTKDIVYSDGTKETSTYKYTGRHSTDVTDFGELITTSLDWNCGSLQAASTSKTTEEKKFSSTTKFTAVYTTTNWKASATNNKESGAFLFSETSPVVTFVDGKTTKVFDARKYTFTGVAPKLTSTPERVVKDGVSYDAYPYNYTVKASFDGTALADLVSNGTLLKVADVVGSASYKPSQTWDGKTTTVQVIKTIPHSAADDEVLTYTQKFTVAMSDLTDGKLYADNTDFKATGSHTESSSVAKDGLWSTKTYTRNYTYVLSNGTVKRDDLKTTVKDAEITFTDGSYSYTFDARLDISAKDTYKTAYQEGNYDVTPHVLTITAKPNTGSQSFTTSGTTSIYVKRVASITGHTEKTVVYSDGTVDAFVTLTKDDGTSETVKVSDAFGSRFAFNFTNATAQEKVVSSATHTASGSVGNPTSEVSSKGDWKVTTYKYPYNHVLSNGTAADNVNSSYAYRNYEFVYQGNGQNITLPRPTVNMTNKSLNITSQGKSGDYDVYKAAVVVNGSASGTEGSYTTDLAVTHTLKVLNNEPEQPHLGKPKNFVVTATYDPSSKVTRRAFVFVWDQGVTYAVCDYETQLPATADFKYKESSYTGYNSVGYDKDNSDHWQPARGSDDSDAIRWYSASGSLISAIDKALSCKVIGWKNLVNGDYALVIPGYTYTINGYNITVTSPNGQKVTFNSHHN